jgi:hypothetical protein
LKVYVRQGKLVVNAEATYDELNQDAVVKQHGNKLRFEEFREYFAMDQAGKKAAELVAFNNN